MSNEPAFLPRPGVAGATARNVGDGRSGATRSHAQAPWREHGEDGEHRTLPEVRTVARLTAVGRSDGLHRYVAGCSGDWAWSSSGAAVPNTKLCAFSRRQTLTRRWSVRSNLSG